jgi:beta-mannosidase
MSDIMKWHQRCPLGNDRIKNMTGNYFQPGKDFDNALWVSQLVQAYGIKLGAEYWRQHMPQSMGCLFWQYNDCWPVASWASVDYFGRWKALHYAARHFYAPVLVSGLENLKAKTVDIYLTSDLSVARQGTVKWHVTDLQGTVLADGTLTASIAPRTSLIARTLDLGPLADQHGENNLLLWLNCETDARETSQNLVTFGRPKELAMADPQLKAEVAATQKGFTVKISAARPALWAWLGLSGLDARYSDNFVHLDGHTAIEIDVVPAQSMTLAEFEKALTVNSLFDTYSPAA